MTTITKNSKSTGKVSGFTTEDLMFDAVVKGGMISSLFVSDRETGELAYYLDGKSEGQFDDVLNGRNIETIKETAIVFAG